MHRAYFLVLLAVCHGRPLTSTVPTTSEGTLSYRFTLPSLSILPTGTPLTAVTTTSEDPPTTTRGTIGSESTTTTVTPTSAETLPHLVADFGLERCAEPDTTCFFLPRCVFSTHDSLEMLYIPVTPSFLKSMTEETRRALTNCDVAVIVARGELVVHQTLPISNPGPIMLAVHGLSIDTSGEVLCAGCKAGIVEEHPKRFVSKKFVLPTRSTTKSRRRRTTTATAITTTSPLPPLSPCPLPPSRDTDPTEDGTEAGARAKQSDKCDTSVTGTVIICLLVAVVLVVLAVIIVICRTTRKLRVQPVGPVANAPPAWSSKRTTTGSAKSNSSTSVVPEWPQPLPSIDSTEDYDEHTPLAPVPSPPGRTPATAVSIVRSFTKSLFERGVEVKKDKEGAERDFSAKPPSLPKASPTREISVTPSKDPEQNQMLKTPELKRPPVVSAAGLAKSTSRTPLKLEKPTQSSSYAEVSL